MKKLLTTFIAVVALSHATNASYVDLVSLGSSGFSVDPGATTAGSQTASGITFSPSISLADTIGGAFTAGPLDWDAYSPATDFALKLSILSGSNPNLPFSLSLVDGSSNILNFVGVSSDLNAQGYVPLTLNGTDPGNPVVLAAVTAAQLTWDGGATANVSAQAIAAVPEPSTYALLALSSLAVTGYMIRRRRRA